MSSRPDNGPGSEVATAALASATTILVLALARRVALTATAVLAGKLAQRSAR